MTKTKHNKAALITGGAQRIGKALAIALAQKGYDIALHYHKSRTQAQQTVLEIKKLGRKCKLYSANLLKEHETQKLVSQSFKDFPALYLLINNASVFKKNDFLKTSSKIFNENFDLHVKAPFFLTQAFAKKCKNGNIINLLDAKIVQNQTQYFAYLLSKKTLLHFTQMAALELAPQIRVNAIAPGLILPPQGQTDTYLKKLAQTIPLRKTGNLKQVTQATSFLLENDYITGQCLFLDGGLHLL